jgi:hypothetical protein
MLPNYHTKLNFDDIIIVSTKEFPGIFFPAKIEQIVECNFMDKNSIKVGRPVGVSYQYNLRTVDYEDNPFINFPNADTNFLTWDELNSFDTLDRWVENMGYFMKGVIKIEKIG